VTPSASGQEITKAYRALVSRYHPDKHQDNELKDLAEQKLAELNEAYEVLSNPTSRAAYDAERRQPGFAPGASPQSYGRVTMTPFPFTKLLVVLAFIAGAFFAVRFIRNPRLGAIVGAVIAAAWFGPRIVRYFKSKAK
jgi:curved DNA-binding protein CbpA